MPAAKRAVAVNIGMQTVTMAVFELGSDGGLVLSGSTRANLVADPAMDASRPGQLKIAVGELRAKLKPVGGDCAIAIPSQGVFTRFVKIPKVDGGQAAQMLHFEAQQNVPYPIEEVSWCYQVLPEKEEDKLGAVILAAKLDQLEETVGAVREGGLSPTLIETSPTSLYNSLRYNYPDLGGCVLLIDIGARATNLIFAEGDRLFVRTLPVGGSSITAALQKKFDGRPLIALEDAKVKEGFIAPSGNFDTQGGDAAEIGKIARTVMTRIHNEITRSITFYRTNQQGSPPMRVLLTGGGAAMPYTLEFFNEKLSLPVEFFDPLRRVFVAASADTANIRHGAHNLGECVGLATRLLLQDCPLEVRLESPQLRTAAGEKKRRPFMVAAALTLALLFGISLTHFQKAADRLAVESEKLDGQIAPLDTLKRQLDAAGSRRTKLLEESADLAAAPMLRTAWANILDELSSKMPSKKIWITRLHPMVGDQALVPSAGGGSWSAQGGSTKDSVPQKSGGKPAVTAVAVDGLYLESETGPAIVDEFVEGLVQSAIFAVSPEQKNEIVKLRSAQTGDSWAYEYQLVLPLRRPIPL